MIALRAAARSQTLRSINGAMGSISSRARHVRRLGQPRVVSKSVIANGINVTRKHGVTRIARASVPATGRTRSRTAWKKTPDGPSVARSRVGRYRSRGAARAALRDVDCMRITMTTRSHSMLNGSARDVTAGSTRSDYRIPLFRHRWVGTRAGASGAWASRMAGGDRYLRTSSARAALARCASFRGRTRGVP